MCSKISSTLVFGNVNRPQWMTSEIWEFISKKLSCYNEIRCSVDTVLYVGMADDILTPLLAFNAKKIIAVDSVDISYGSGSFNPFLFKMEDGFCLNLSLFYINDIGVFIENLGGRCHSMEREIISTNSGDGWGLITGELCRASCPVIKYTMHFSFPTFDAIGTTEDRELIYYVFQNYKDWLPPEAMKGIDAYISVGSPDYLEIPSHFDKVKTR